MRSLLAFAGMLVGTHLIAAERDPEVVYAEQVLAEAAIKTDGASLLAYLRQHILTEAKKQEVSKLIRLLGDDDFYTREEAMKQLLHVGRFALHELEQAVRDRDPEIRWRAAHCLKAINVDELSPRLAAVIRLIQDRNPAESDRVLLAYLPSASNEEVERTAFVALAHVGTTKGGKPTPSVVESLQSEKAIQRAAAAYVMGRATSADEGKRLTGLLRDADPRVRFEAAVAITYQGKRWGPPVLIALLEDGPLHLAWRAEELLFHLAGDGAPSVGLSAGDDQRRKIREAWQKWWEERGDKVDLASIKNEPVLLGRLLVCIYDGERGGQVVELGKANQERWAITGLNSPNDVQLLPGGRVLVAERNGGQVTERNREGKILWQYSTGSNAIVCQRMRNGNTLVGSYSHLLEVDPAGKSVHQYAFTGSNLRHAIELPNRHILGIASTGEIIELDSQWKTVHTITPEKYASGAGYWGSVEPIAGGRYLVTLGSAGKVVELDRGGKIHWEQTFPNPVFARRLRNGNTLVSLFEDKCLVEVNRAGKEVARIPLKGRPFTVRQY